MRLTRKFVIDTVIQKLAQIRTANGYSCEIGQQVDYGEGIQSNPTLDCVAVIDGPEAFGQATRPGVRERTLTLYLSAIFYESNPLERANLAAEDVLVWLDKNASLGLQGMRITVVSMGTILEEAGQLAELGVELRLTY